MKNNTDHVRSKRKTLTTREYIRKIGVKYLLLFLMLPAFFLFLLYMNYTMIYRLISENINYKANATLLEYCVTLDDYLGPALNILESMSYNLEDKLKTMESNSEIRKYLVRETSTLDESQSLITTGIYGYINGEYLDGSLWQPEEGYIPTERPWYIDAKERDGDITYVSPYTDSQTGDRIMTISRLLSDKKSVIAVDIKMNELQTITESLVPSGDDASEVIIIDEDGTVVTHSRKTEAGKNYLETEVEPSKTIIRKLLKEGLSEFNVSRDGANAVVYSRELEGGWYVLSVTNESRMFARIFDAVRNSFIAGFIGTLVILQVMYIITKKTIESEDYDISLSSVSSIYLLMYRIDLKNDTFEEINCNLLTVADMVGDKRSDAAKLIKNVLTLRSDERTREDILEFVDLSTLEERLSNINTITCEFMNPDKIWNRARFIVAERDEKGNLESVLFMVELIDEEKKARERLQYLSETDRMTGINNRGSGENKIRKQLLTGDGGMFLLLDVDKFKSINDNYGHGVGDKVIIAVADCMKKAFRNNDIIMRLGGDEFAAFAPLVLSREGGEIIIDRFLNQVGRISIPELLGRKVEVSIGVSFYQPEDQFTFDELYKQADECTYKSKEIKGSVATYYSRE